MLGTSCQILALKAARLHRFNSLSNNKILDWSKLKALAEDNIMNVLKMMISVFDCGC